MKLSQVVRMLDFTGLQYVPLHKGYRRHRTVVGGISNILVILALASLFFAELKGLVNRENFTLASTLKTWPVLD